MIGLDTNVLLRWLMADALTEEEDLGQAALVGDFMSAEEDKLFVNHIVLIETIWVLKRRVKLSRASLASVMTKILDSPIVVADPHTVTAAMDMYSRYPGDFSDHLIAAVNQQNGCRTTMTFDKAASKSPNFSELQR
jgi:predicted nucleic-acid-binding protein